MTARHRQRRVGSKLGAIGVLVALMAAGCQYATHHGSAVAAPTVTSSVSSPAVPAGPTTALGSTKAPGTYEAPKSSTHPASPTRSAVAVPAMPTKLAIPAIGLKVGYSSDSEIGTVVSSHGSDGWTITPPEETWKDLQSAYWWSETKYSVLPGDPSQGSTFIYMHACSQVQCAGNSLHNLQAGDVIIVTTSKGVLRYRIAKVLKLDKSTKGIGASTEFYSYGVPNQLRLATCGYAADGSSPFNWAVIAALQH